MRAAQPVPDGEELAKIILVVDVMDRVVRRVVHDPEAHQTDPGRRNGTRVITNAGRACSQRLLECNIERQDAGAFARFPISCPAEIRFVK